ncbi:UNVERIFIED_CONTAM: hypothetical protein PYX00_002863 [Menopon gallinae]|uniref:Uncharacterized protein n=1 Tax=Menopon gallinae TaxID=328185 RepID=A0AAW2HY80_9NEOP
MADKSCVMEKNAGKKHETDRESDSVKGNDNKIGKEPKGRQRAVSDAGATPVVSALSDVAESKQATPTVSALDKRCNRTYYRRSKNGTDDGQQRVKQSSRNANSLVQTSRYYPSQKYKNRRRSDDESRCSTPSSTTSTLSNASSETDLDDRDLMPMCKTVAEGGEGLPLMQT